MIFDLIKLVLILLAIVIPVLIIQYRLDVSRIRKSVQEKGWCKAKITPLPVDHRSLKERNKRFYRVDYLNAEEKECFAICKASVLGGISWENE